jgi:hypothetical protein
MPSKPRKNERRDSYMSRCVKELKNEGTSGTKAKDICAAVWFSNKKRKK